MLRHATKRLLRPRPTLVDVSQWIDRHLAERSKPNRVLSATLRSSVSTTSRPCVTFRPTVQPVLFRSLRRNFSTFNNAQDTHLNDKNEIADEYIRKRLALLEELGFLSNPWYIHGRIIYENCHLYEPTEDNLERMAKGNAPLDLVGDVLVLHHLDQKHRGPIVVMPNRVHAVKDKQLHSRVTVEDSVDRSRFARERANYWKEVHSRLTPNPHKITLRKS